MAYDQPIIVIDLGENFQCRRNDPNYQSRDTGILSLKEQVKCGVKVDLAIGFVGLSMIICLVVFYFLEKIYADNVDSMDLPEIQDLSPKNFDFTSVWTILILMAIILMCCGGSSYLLMRTFYQEKQNDLDRALYLMSVWIVTQFLIMPFIVLVAIWGWSIFNWFVILVVVISICLRIGHIGFIVEYSYTLRSRDENINYESWYVQLMEICDNFC